MASKELNLVCSQCRSPVVQYKKQGTGSLIRLYLDRITGPPMLAKLKQTAKKSELTPLVCPKCQTLIGVPMIHEGQRLAFRMVKGSFRRQRS